MIRLIISYSTQDQVEEASAAFPTPNHLSISKKRLDPWSPGLCEGLFPHNHGLFRSRTPAMEAFEGLFPQNHGLFRSRIPAMESFEGLVPQNHGIFRSRVLAIEIDSIR